MIHFYVLYKLLGLKVKYGYLDQIILIVIGVIIIGKEV